MLVHEQGLALLVSVLNLHLSLREDSSLGPSLLENQFCWEILEIVEQVSVLENCAPRLADFVLFNLLVNVLRKNAFLSFQKTMLAGHVLTECLFKLMECFQNKCRIFHLRSAGRHSSLLNSESVRLGEDRPIEAV